MNVILIILDTLRQDHVGCYGNDWIRTPSLDALARQSVQFTRAYPEILPTLPARRVLHTGQRLFPPPQYLSYKGDFSGAPGWGPMLESQDSISELLQSVGFRTALISDTYHQFKPSKNFHRGFDQWNWIRGQEADSYRSGPAPDPEVIRRHLPARFHNQLRIDSLTQYLTNVSGRQTEEDYFAPQVFRAATRWLEQNRDAEKFFLVIDSFDPHEPWDPPTYYRQMYEPQTNDVVDMIFSPYGPSDQLTAAELQRLRANYAGEVTMVDRWLGYFLDAVESFGLKENSLLIVVSDHGHCLGEQGLVSKQGHPMSREVADLCLWIRHPSGEKAGTDCDAFVYHHDLAATILGYAGIGPRQPLDGRDLWPLITGEEESERNHVTVGWGPFLMVRDDRYWYNAFLWGESPLLYDLSVDPQLQRSLAADQPELCEHMLRMGLQELGGEVPEYLRTLAEAREPGCTPLGKR